MDELAYRFQIGNTNIVVCGYGLTEELAKASLPKMKISKEEIDIRPSAQLILFNDIHMNKESYIDINGEVAYR